MDDAPLETIRQVRQFFREWLGEVRKSPDPASQPAGQFQIISEKLQTIDAALQAAPPSLTATEIWKTEVGEYADTLRELRARLANFEITLRIRSSEMAKKQAHLDAIHSWADLVKRIG